MTQLTLLSHVSFVFNVAALLLLVLGWFLFRRKKDLVRHARLMMVSSALMYVFVFLNMIPVLFTAWSDISQHLSDPLHQLILVHAPFGVAAVVVSGLVIGRYGVTRSPFSCYGKRTMYATMVLLLIALLTGIVVYVGHLVLPVM